MDSKRAVGTGGGDELRARVEAVMARLAGGEQQAMWDLHDLAEPWLRRMVRAEARRIDIRLGDDDVIDLTLDAAIALGHLAHAWKPDGALPWVWARRRIAALVHAHAGTFAKPLDETHLDIEASAVLPPVDDPRGVLRSLARHHPAARRIEQLLAETTSDRDAAIWLGVQLERGAGNRSPAVTVGVDHGLRTDAVRKVVQRVGERLDERLEPVA